MPTTSTPRRLITSTEAAAIAGLTPHAIGRRVRAGLLQQYRDGSDLRIRLIDQSELERLLTPAPLPRRSEVEPLPAA